MTRTPRTSVHHLRGVVFCGGFCAAASVDKISTLCGLFLDVALQSLANLVVSIES